MTRAFIGRQLAAGALAFTILLVPVAATAQVADIKPPKNKYKVSDDIKLGNDAAREIEAKLPFVNDRDATDYVARVGSRLVQKMPVQFRRSEFIYRFRIVNASDLNAFALPGGPMYVNRGMIEKARSEGEMAGVMAHEISHVALRHATAQVTKQSSWKNQLGMLGMVLGGAVLAGEAGAQLGMLGAAAWMTKYSREYETQADQLGATIMADAGYDPRDLANVFRTIAAENKGGAPEWLSSHPDPGNRFEKINRMAETLRIGPSPPRFSPGFSQIQSRLRAMPPAKTMAQIEKESQGQGTSSPTAGGRYRQNVPYPSGRTRQYTNLNWMRVSVPGNWRDFTGGDSVQFAPDGAYGDSGITHGAMIGLYKGDEYSFDVGADSYLNDVLQANSYLRVRSRYSRTTVAARPGYMATLAGRSPITGRTEVVNIFVARFRGDLIVYATTVAPEDESGNYNYAFRNMLDSLRLYDQNQ